jgi:SAM-dependent methyltransferase
MRLLRQAIIFSVEGLDISRSAVAGLTGEFGDRVRQADIASEPLPASRYDVIVLFNVLEHLRDPGPVLDKCYRALKADGVLIGSVPNNFGLVGRTVTGLTNYFDCVSALSPAAAPV